MTSFWGAFFGAIVGALLLGAILIRLDGGDK